MIVNINPDWRIISDPLQWTVQRRRTVKGRDKWDSLTFFRDLERAVLWLARRRVLLMDGEYGPEALIPLSQALDSLASEIREALRTVRTEADAWDVLQRW